MKKQARTFRCPEELVVQARKLEQLTGMSFTEIEGRAIELYAKHLRRYQFMVVPDYPKTRMKPYMDMLGGYRVALSEPEFVPIAVPEEVEYDEDEDDSPLFTE